MYAVGGCDENNFRLNSVERYNTATNTWSFTAPMTTCRSSPCVLTCRALYVIGGVSYVGMSLNTGEYLDPVTNAWRPIAPMHDKRASAPGAATNGKIYVIGKPLISKIKGATLCLTRGKEDEWIHKILWVFCKMSIAFIGEMNC